MPIFCFSRNEEHFTASVDVATVEEAIQVARSELETEEGDTFYVGEREEIDPSSYVDGDSLLEEIACQIYDDVGECSEGWPDASKQEVELLTERLQRVVREWIAETGNEPTFYAVRNMQTVQD